jgi:hypothetical protein
VKQLSDASKATLLRRYLALPYARDLAEAGSPVREKLGLDESGRLPVVLPLRPVGAFLCTQPDDGCNFSSAPSPASALRSRISPTRGCATARP